MSDDEQLLAQEQHRSVVRVVSVFLFVLGLVLAFLRFDDLRGAIFTDLNSYATAQGKIVTSQVSESFARYREKAFYEIRYEFSVAGTAYTSDQINFGYKGGENIARLYSIKYPVGQSVTVFYLPADPSFSVLEPDVSGDTRAVLLVTCLLFVLAALGLLWAYLPSAGRVRRPAQP